MTIQALAEALYNAYRAAFHHDTQPWNSCQEERWRRIAERLRPCMTRHLSGKDVFNAFNMDRCARPWDEQGHYKERWRMVAGYINFLRETKVAA